MAFNITIETKFILLLESLFKQVLPDNKETWIDLNTGKVLKHSHWYPINFFKHFYKQICLLPFPFLFMK